MLSKGALDLLNSLKISSDEISKGNYEKRFSRDIMEPFQRLICDVTPFMCEIEPNFHMRSHRFDNVSRLKSTPFVPMIDSVKAVFRRDVKLYPYHPLIQVGITPHYYYIRYSCSTFCSELMDIIRLMAINNDETFSKAWPIVINSDNIRLSGKRYGNVHGMGDSRFYFYPDEKIKYFLAFRNISFLVFFDTKYLGADNFICMLKEQIISSLPLYHFLLSASNAIEHYTYESEILTQWSIHPQELKKLSIKQKNSGL